MRFLLWISSCIELFGFRVSGVIVGIILGLLSVVVMLCRCLGLMLISW